MQSERAYTHWVEIDGEIVGKAFPADQGESGTRMVFVELPHLPGVAFLAAVHQNNLRPMKTEVMSESKT